VIRTVRVLVGARDNSPEVDATRVGTVEVPRFRVQRVRQIANISLPTPAEQNRAKRVLFVVVIATP
jgi:hypothetical protein